MDLELVNRFGGLSLPRKSVVRLTDRPEMTLDVNSNIIGLPVTTFSIAEIVIHLPERTETGLLTASD